MKYLIFSGLDCKPCEALKTWLDSHGVKYEEFDVEERHEFAGQYGITRGVPVSIKLNQGIEVNRMTGFNGKNLNEAKQFFGV